MFRFGRFTVPFRFFRIHRKFDHPGEIHIGPRRAHRIIPVTGTWQSFGNICSMSGNPGSDDSFLHILQVRQPQVLRRCHVAQEISSVGGSNRTADTGNDGALNLLTEGTRLGRIHTGGNGDAFFRAVLIAALLLLLVLAVLRLADRRMPQLSIMDVRVCYRRSDAHDEPSFRQLMSDHGFHTGAVSQRLWSGEDEGRARVEYSATLRGSGRPEVDDLARTLREDPQVIEYRLVPRND